VKQWNSLASPPRGCALHPQPEPTHLSVRECAHAHDAVDGNPSSTLCTQACGDALDKKKSLWLSAKTLSVRARAVGSTSEREAGLLRTALPIRVEM